MIKPETPLVCVILDPNSRELLRLADQIQLFFPHATIQPASTLRSARDLIAKVTPALVIISLSETDTSGFELMVSHPVDRRSFALLALAPELDEGLKKRASECGADEVLTVPIDELTFQGKIQALLQKAYSSPKVLYGGVEGLGGFEIRAKVQIELINEEIVGLATPWLIRRGASVQLLLGDLTIPILVTECTRNRKNDGVFDVKASIADGMTMQQRAQLRKWIRIYRA